MIEIGRRALALYAAIALAAGLIDLLVFSQGLVHAQVILLAVLVTAIVADHLIDRREVAVIAAATVTVWPLVHQAPMAWLGMAMVPAAALLVPSVGRAWDAIGLVVTTVVVGYLLARALYPALGAGLLVGVLVLLRPRHPTKDQIRLLRSTALALPAIGLVAAIGIGLGLDLPPQPIRTTLWLSITLAAFLGLGALAGLGLATLVESTHPSQASVWNASMMSIALVLAGLAGWLPGAGWGALEVAAVAAVPMAALAGLAAIRLRAGGTGIMTMFVWLPPALAMVQTGV